MAIDIGDAILTFTGDSTQLNATLDSVGTQVPAKMGAATNAIQDTAGAVDQMTERMAVGANGAVELGQMTTLAGEETRASMYEARGELGLIGEAFGIHLPRHVRSFVAELPGVGAALSGAFAATAVLFLIDALVKGIEKITEWAEHGEKIAQAWEKYDQTIFESSTHMQKEIDKQEQKLLEMTQGPVAGLDFALKHLQTTAFETFSLITKDVDAAVKAMNEASSSLVGIQFNVFKDAGKDLEKFRLELEKVMRQAAEAAPKDPFAAYNAGITLVQQKEGELTKLITDRTAASGKDASAAVDGLHAERQAVNAMLPLLQQGIRLQQDKENVAKQSLADATATKQGAQEKLSLDLQIAGIEKWKNEQTKAYAEGKITAADWQVAEVRATTAANLAKEDYFARLIVIYQKAGEAEKARAAQQELAKVQAQDAAKATAALAAEEEKHRQAVAKITAEYQKLVEAKIDKDFAATEKATQDLAKANETLLKTQTALDVENSAKRYHDQEEAIKQLASMQLITEQQKNAKLIQLYNQQEAAALKSLQDQLAKEKAIIDAAQVKVKSAEGNPFFTDAQVLELKNNLVLAETAYLKTQDQISKTEDKFEKERLALQKGAIGQAIALATAAGNQKLALDLKQHQSALIAIKDQIDLAKARGQDVSAMQAQEKEIQNTTNALVKEATQIGKLRQAWDLFSADFSKRAKTDETTAQQMAQSFATAAQGMEQGINAAFAAMVSGTESAGQAMEKAVFKTIASIAQQWGAYYIARGIADVFDDPAAAGAEFAAGAALEALGGVLSGLGSASSGSSKSSGGSSTPAITPNTSTATAAQPVIVTNVPKLSGGGLITHQTLAIVGDSPGGGDQKEAVIPLNDAGAMRGILQAFAGASGGGSGAVSHNYYIQGMVSTQDLVKLTRTITRNANTGRVRMSVTNSARVTKRS